MTKQMFQKWFARGLGLAGLIFLAVAMNTPASVLASAPARPAAAPTGAASLFGIDDGGVLANSDAARALAAATGVNWERISVYWSSLEPTPGNYDFASADAVIPPLLEADLSPIVYLEQNPSWASNTTCGPVNDVQAFADMLGALAARYPKVQVWATYNEVDFDYTDLNQHTGGCFGARSKGGVNNNDVRDYIEYAEMLRAAWLAVHAANPDARLASGAVAYDNFNVGTAPSDYPGHGQGGLFNSNFAADLFKYMKANPLPNDEKYMDMLLFNYYNLYGPYWQKKASGYGIQAKTKVLRKLMSNAGIATIPLFVSETGESSNAGWINAKTQARCLNMTMVRGAAAKLSGIVWWTFRDFPDNATYPRNTWKYGIVDQNLQPKPSYTALQTLAAELNGLDFAKNRSNKNGFKGVEAYYFAGGGLKKYVVWTFSKPNPPDPWVQPECAWPRNAATASFQATSLRVVSYLGKVKTIQDNSKKDKDPAVGKITINVNANPQIVQVNP